MDDAKLNAIVEAVVKELRAAQGQEAGGKRLEAGGTSAPASQPPASSAFYSQPCPVAYAVVVKESNPFW